MEAGNVPTAQTKLSPSTMSVYQAGTTRSVEVVDPTPMPGDVPKVDELGTTSAPLKSAAFFIGAHCKEFNGPWSYLSFPEWQC